MKKVFAIFAIAALTACGDTPTTENASPTTENASPTTENASPTTEVKKEEKKAKP